MDKFQNRYRIPTARAGWHDYSGGMYFVTVCTAGMEHYFDKICDNVMHPVKTGTVVWQNIKHTNTYFLYAQIQQ